MGALYNYSVRETDSLLEVVVRESEGDYFLEITTGVNEVGLLFRLCAVLLAYDCDIASASIRTSGEEVQDVFRIHRAVPLEPEAIKGIVSDLRSLLFDGVSVLEYLTKKGLQLESAGSPGGDVVIEPGPRPAILITTTDKPGLLTALSQAFYLMDIDILEAEIGTLPDGRVENRFYVDGNDDRFSQQAFCTRLSEELQTLL